MAYNTKKLSNQELRQINKNVIFRYLYDNDCVSKQDISTALSLSMPTVNQNIKELTEDGLVVAAGNFESTGGRKAVAITYNKSAVFSVGIAITMNNIRIVVVDLSGEQLYYRKYKCGFEVSDSYAEKLTGYLNASIEESGVDSTKILGVGISVPGIIENEKDFIIKIAPSLHAKNQPLTYITEKIEYEVMVDNDAYLGGVAELWNGKSEKTVAYIYVDKGVGGTIFIDNKPFKGEKNMSAEFGHMVIHPHGNRCNCGKTGCFEAYISTDRLSEDLGISLAEFFKRLDAGDGEVKERFEKYLDDLCIGLSNINTILDADVVLGGSIVEYIDDYIGEIDRKLSEMNPFEKDRYFHIAKIKRAKASAIGAALYFIERFIENI
ncbi:ROK family transcriptional regulator [Anaerobium acetethylicum]|uniref:Sugar kinase of the NBD/HSP70 family, may contain an N-terminal HTH domain n=1 Tax=Anaerobium acetethylicum TaxID=1619234 RepID=A0A1D3TQF4_9FIRM|nr:ROK family transcriptional regulator [Anaerobium acetethylicum]SCP95796.1 Sugar kinase of the NBD/HSP70 family, may contain an N-terminal HTH domain [Anaerobium acetethylicum]